MAEITLDPELLADFIFESRELIEEFTSSLIDLENNPEDTGILSSIFRVAHTIKGSSAFFNLVHIKNFAHKLENLLDELRDRKRPVTSEVIDVLLNGGRHLKNMFNRVQAGDMGSELTPEEDRFLKDLLNFIEKSAAAPEVSPRDMLRRVKELVSEFKTGGKEAKSVFIEIESLLAGITDQEGPPQKQASDNPDGYAIQLESKTYTCMDVDLTSPIEKALAAMAKARETEALDEEAYGRALVELVRLAEDHNLEPIQEPLDEALNDFRSIKESGIGFDPVLTKLTGQKLKEIINLLDVKDKSADQSEAFEDHQTPEADSGPARTARRDKKNEGKTMRIEEKKVDGFMNYVGELIVTAEAFNYLQKLIESERVNPKTLRSFKNTNQAFRELSNSLQESLMEIRRVPLKSLLQKVTLLARELSHKAGKKVKVVIEDHDVRIDKSILESLEGPIIHLVRNSIDHGLETPDEREESHKPPEGLLKVEARTNKDFFYLNLSDDGRGLDPDKIRAGAVRKKLISEEQARTLSDQQVIDLIFSPGFSTAEKVTDVSGRGVGMDVVKTNVTKLNGTINIDSIPGQGTTFSLKIPLSVTLQVINGLLVKVGSQRFIISLDDIVESLRPTPKEISTVNGQEEIINHRGQIYPLIRLHDLLDIRTDVTEPTQAILVMVETPQGRFCLLADEIVGQHQVVVKDLGPQFEDLDFIAGSATLEEGRLGLVLDAEGLVKLAHRS
ncbi:MAG: chemotaxis protein CheA [Deltaproteobacteria bacterium]|nr:chemotaxis protein CheA [Deltaproteobacteria bacterium]MBW2051966.1 chemotaxis protein CheA [Deltaproteobacteria bacterium]MBW2140502.1 chemotaxis protein CheA [Deltaproteobacteria bacterium]MBW2322355.1 chemotaxis protein CheA [Deltaproteobacteria bacterium]